MRSKKTVILLSLLLLATLSGFYLTHRVSQHAHFTTAAVQLNDSNPFGDTELLTGVFAWQKRVTPKVGFVIIDEQAGQVFRYDRSLIMERGKVYAVCHDVNFVPSRDSESGQIGVIKAL